jgi:hypothetical protein
MDEVAKRFARQAQWQASRTNLSWPEKVRQAEAMREFILVLRKKKADSPRRRATKTDADAA